MFAVKFFKNWVEGQSMTEWSSDPEVRVAHREVRAPGG